MRVLMITVRADFGGGPEHIRKLLLNFSEGVEAWVAAPQDKPYWDRFVGIVGPERMLPIAHRRFLVQDLVKMLFLVRRCDIEIIHSHGKGAGVYARLLRLLTGRPLIHTHHGIHIGHYSPVGRYLYLAYERLTGRLAQRNIFLSESEWELARRHKIGLGIPMTIIPNGVEDVSEEQRDVWRLAARRKLRLGPQEFVVATVTRFDYQKNMEEALEIAKLTPTARFLWIGDGPERATLERRVRAEGLGNVTFAGFVESSLPFLAASDAYLSTSRWEGMPLAVLEAMSVGLPVVASDVPGNRDVVVHGTYGFLYPLGDISMAVGFLERLRANASLRNRFSTRALEAQRRCFSVAKMVALVEKCYAELINHA